MFLSEVVELQRSGLFRYEPCGVFKIELRRASPSRVLKLVKEFFCECICANLKQKSLKMRA